MKKRRKFRCKTVVLPNDRTRKIVLGNCVRYMRTLPKNSIDACVTDPPYLINFMGKRWDNVGSGRAMQHWHMRWAKQLFRVLKPGAYVLAFGGSRTYHRLACALEDVGFEVRDCIVWLYGSGFPKSLDISKAIDKMKGKKRKVVGTYNIRGFSDTSPTKDGRNQWAAGDVSDKRGLITTPASKLAKLWKGWGTALKPGMEPCVLVRKPLVGTVAQNVLEHGVGGINIDACRVIIRDNENKEKLSARSGGSRGFRKDGYVNGEQDGGLPAGWDASLGRWPANVILTHHHKCKFNGPATCHKNCPVRMLDEQTGILTSGKLLPHHKKRGGAIGTFEIRDRTGESAPNGTGSSGGASRFFLNTAWSVCNLRGEEDDHENVHVRFAYYSKPSRREREGGLEGFAKHGPRVLVGRKEGSAGALNPRAGAGRISKGRANIHPTVKPKAIIRYLIKLIVPRGGTVIDPFAGSGTIFLAAPKWCNVIGIEKENSEEQPYYTIAKARMMHAAAKHSRKPKPQYTSLMDAL